MSERKIYGFNIAVKDLNAAKGTYEKLFGVTSEYVPEEAFAFPGLEAYRLNVNGLAVHLIASKTDNTSVAKFLQKNGEGMFLISMQVDDIEKEQNIIKEEMGAQFILDKPVDAGWCKVNFIHPRSLHGVQVEVIEVK
ncbi:MAG: VOC family protein [Desulfitobacteriaceae bacterium]